MLRVLAIIVALSAFSTLAHAEKRVALVIGNSDYKLISPLSNPKNDAILMATTLKSVGFEVVSAIDVDYRGMRRAVRQFGRVLRRSGKDAVGLLYYAGHGIQARGANYLIPLGADIQTAADLEIEALSASNVLAQMEEAGNRLNLVVLDACRNNPFKSAVRTAGRGLARISAASGSLVAFSAAPGQVAADGLNENSPYTASLVEAIRQPGLSVEQVFKRTRVNVKSLTGGQQTPWEESSLEGDFYFVPRVPEPAVSAIPSKPVDRQALFWNSVKDADNPALFQIYVDRYPDGTFVDLARAMMDDLRAKAAKVEKKREEKLAALTPPASAIEPDQPTSPEDMAALARRYETGDGLVKDAARAASWYRKAANGGHAGAKYRLGLLYYRGAGVGQSWSEAAILILGAIKSRHGPAIEAVVNRKTLRDSKFVRALQERLKVVGRFRGAVDGRWGNQTETAILIHGDRGKPKDTDRSTAAAPSKKKTTQSGKTTESARSKACPGHKKKLSRQYRFWITDYQGREIPPECRW